MKEYMAGIDLHSNNLVIGIMDLEGHRVAHQKLDCDLEAVRKFLQPYKKHLKRLAVESTYNWYWLVDGLQDDGYPIVLANPARIEQYSGIKHADDKNDAYFLAELLRLDILPTGYVYDADPAPGARPAPPTDETGAAADRADAQLQEPVHAGRPARS